MVQVLHLRTCSPQVVDTTATNPGNAYVRSTALTDPVIADNTDYQLQINGIYPHGG